MDNILPQLLTFPPHPPPPQPLSDVECDKQIRQLVSFLSTTSASKLVTGVSNAGDLLEFLDPSRNSLPYLHTLLAHIAASKGLSPTSPLWLRMLDFVNNFDAIQIRYAGYEFRRLIDAVVRGAEKTTNPITAIQPIRTAMLRLDPTTSCFTSTHLVFVRLCLQTRAYSLALPILDNDIYHFPATTNKNSPLLSSQHDTPSTFITTVSGLSDQLEHKDHLMYFLYGAMIYMGLKDWERALLFLEIVIISPAVNTASMIQIEAYKKRVLVGLMLTGGPLPTPPTTSPQCARLCRAIAKAYDILALTFKNEGSDRLLEEVSAGQQIWQSDQNHGLVQQVIAAHRRFAILSLGKTYVAVSISAVTARISTSQRPISESETEGYIRSLIDSGQLNATLSPPILRFASSNRDGPLGRSEQQQCADLIRHKEKMDVLNLHLKGAGRKLEITKEHLEHTKRQRKIKESGIPARGLLGGPIGVDEDMMAEL